MPADLEATRIYDSFFQGGPSSPSSPALSSSGARTIEGHATPKASLQEGREVRRTSSTVGPAVRRDLPPIIDPVGQTNPEYDVACFLEKQGLYPLQQAVEEVAGNFVRSFQHVGYDNWPITLHNGGFKLLPQAPWDQTQKLHSFFARDVDTLSKHRMTLTEEGVNELRVRPIVDGETLLYAAGIAPAKATQHDRNLLLLAVPLSGERRQRILPVATGLIQQTEPMFDALWQAAFDVSPASVLSENGDRYYPHKVKGCKEAGRVLGNIQNILDKAFAGGNVSETTAMVLTAYYQAIVGELARDNSHVKQLVTDGYLKTTSRRWKR